MSAVLQALFLVWFCSSALKPADITFRFCEAAAGLGGLPAEPCLHRVLPMLLLPWRTLSRKSSFCLALTGCDATDFA